MSRPFESAADLRLMQSLQQELRALERERTQTHVGDLAWWATMHARREHEWKRRLWLDGDRCVARAWLHRPASLDYEVHVDRRGGAVHAEVPRAWPYRSDLDCVGEAPDGTFATYVLCWYDEANRVGEFEPVGTHPAYRRRGLGAAVCSYALARLNEVGARKAIVYAGGREEDGPARALYESIGFRRHTRVTELRKER